MEKLKKVFRFLAHLHPVLAWPVIVAGFAQVIYVLAAEQSGSPMAFAAYFLSALSLILLCFRLPGTIRFWLDFKKTNPFAVRYFSDVQYRARFSLYISTAINLLYAALQLGSGIHQHSVWFYALSGYYAILAIARFFLLRETQIHELGKDRWHEYLLYRLTAVLLLVLNLAMGAISTFVVIQNRGFVHHEIITIAMAAYTFYSLTMAIVSIFRYRKYRSPVLSASKHISLASALVSMLSLETSMFASFGQDTAPSLRFWITALSGAAIFITVLALAVYMLRLARSELNKMKGMNPHGTVQ